MKLAELINTLVEPTGLSVSVSEREITEPSELYSIEVHHEVGDAVKDACLSEGFSAYAAYAFGEWLAELVTGWSTRYSNEMDILELDDVFSIAAFGDRKSVIRCYLAPNFNTLLEHLPEIQRGILAVFEHAKGLH